MNAAFMSFQPHEGGIHAVWPDWKYVINDAVVADALFRVRATPPPADARLNGRAYLVAASLFRSAVWGDAPGGT